MSPREGRLSTKTLRRAARAGKVRWGRRWGSGGDCGYPRTMASKRRSRHARARGQEIAESPSRQAEPATSSNRAVARLQASTSDVDELTVRGSIESARATFEEAKQLERGGEPLEALRKFEEVASSPLRPYVEQELDEYMATCVERLAAVGQTSQVFATDDPVRIARILARAAVRLFRHRDFSRAAGAFEALYSQPASPALGHPHVAFDVVASKIAAGDASATAWATQHAAAVAEVMKDRGAGDWDLVPEHQSATSMAAQPEAAVAIDSELEDAVELFHSGAFADALRGFEAVRSKAPSDEVAYDTAICLALLGRYREALRVAAEAGGLAPAALAALIGDEIVEPGGILASHW